MTNSKKLEEVIKKSGMKKKALAEKIGLSAYGFSMKINNKNEFKASEIQKLSVLLNLTQDEREVIFFGK